MLTDAGTFFYRNASLILGQLDKLAYDMSTIRGSAASSITYTSEAGDFTNESRILYYKCFPEREVVELRETTRETLESLRRAGPPLPLPTRTTPMIFSAPSSCWKSPCMPL